VQLASSAALGGGSCTGSGDCDDANACTTDTCISNNCQHTPVASGAPCGDPSDTTCTDPDTCNAVGVCQRNDAADGITCSLPNLCYVGETCDFGFCRGTYTFGCCTIAGDCNDHNPCTTDSCAGNTCTHTAAPAGTPCGSGVDGSCTNPDTCNATGQCQANDTADGQDCGGLDCLGGQCGGSRYRASLLPEGGNAGSEPRGIHYRSSTNAHIIAGRVISAALVDHAAVWSCPVGSEACSLTLLPEGGAGTSVANGVVCDAAGCVAVGSKSSPRQPAVWIDSGGGWNEATASLPSGETGGNLRFVGLVEGMTAGVTPSFLAVGETTNTAIQMKRAAYCGSNLSISLLPALSLSRRSGASEVIQCSAGAPAGLCDAGELLIAGFAEDGPGAAHPVVWREASAFSSNFTITQLPLPAGTLGLDLNSWDSGEPATVEYDDAGRLISIVATSEGSTKGAVWRTEDFVSWTSAVLPPLTGQANGKTKTKKVRIEAGATGTTGPVAPLGLAVYGSSYPSSGGALDGWGVKWILDPDTLAMTSGPLDLAIAFSGLPQASTYNPIVFRKRIDAGGRGGSSSEPEVFAGVVHELSGATQPHAAVAMELGPAGIPAVSAWGVLVLALLMASAATVALVRRRQLWPIT
jgi:hypothetical protein